MCHPGIVDIWELIGSPYSALGPINASEMMHTSRNACRQSRVSPFIPTAHESTRISIPMWLLYKPTHGECTCVDAVGAFCFTVPAEPCQLLFKKYILVRAMPFLTLSVFSFLPLILLVVMDKGYFCKSGQLHQIQKTHQGRHTAIPCRTMRWKGQWKTYNNERRFNEKAIELQKAL